MTAEAKTKDAKFFQMFGEMGRYLLEATELLSGIVREPSGDTQTAAARIRTLEHAGDDLSHKVGSELNRTFITSLDREDIHDLSVSLDDVLDVIDATAARIRLFRVGDSIPETPEMAETLRLQVREIAAALGNFGDTGRIQKHCIEINRLENEADRLYQAAIGRLFDEEKDPIAVIKKKEIIEMLETATDKAEDVADVLETMIVRAGG